MVHYKKLTKDNKVVLEKLRDKKYDIYSNSKVAQISLSSSLITISVDR